MLSHAFLYINEKKISFLLYKWAFVFFTYVVFLSFFRIFSSNIGRIKDFCLKARVASNFLISSFIGSLFESNYLFFAACALLLYSNELLNLNVVNEILDLSLQAVISAFLANGSFVNVYSSTFLSVYDALFNKKNNMLPSFEVFNFYGSNLLVLFFWSLMKPVESDILDNFINFIK